MRKTLANPRLWIFVFSALAVSMFAIVDMGKKSPGPLSAVHERAPDLDGGGACSECHGGWRRSMSQACLACHADVASQVEAGSGLHGKIARSEIESCAHCHSEHHGSSFAMVNRQSFAAAGAPGGPEAFDHAFVGYAMEGKHLEADCTQCHVHANEEVLPEGARRFMGLERDCASCHEDPHEGRMTVRCAECHGQASFGDVSFARHDDFLPLVGGHAGVDCRACHGKGNEHALESLGRRAEGLSPAPRDCTECHVTPHRREFVAGTSALLSMEPGAACVACHRAEHESFRDERLTLSPEQHAISGFALDAPHDRAACADCHSAAEGDFAARHPGRGADDCRSCHADPHGGQFFDDGDGNGETNPRSCLECHDRHRFVPDAFTVEKHALTALPLTGRHRDARCDACHGRASEFLPRVFHGTPSDCDECHADAHRGFFASGTGEGEACSTCHLTTLFSEMPESGFDHGRWTRFDLSGAHAEAACEACHRPSDKKDALGRTFGRVADHFGRIEGCVSCHADPHGGAFDAKRLPAEVSGRKDCARCHGETSFRTLAAPFDHGLWTGFPLTGAHGAETCSSCHPTLRVPGAGQRTRERARGAACAGCHADPHAGQFVEKKSGRADCARCHESATAFSEIDFNHNIDSRFPLGDTHDRVACAGCHKPFVHEGKDVIRYRPLPTDCVDCHGDNAEPLKRRKREREGKR